eukprot:gene366-biopygen1851
MCSLRVVDLQFPVVRLAIVPAGPAADTSAADLKVGRILSATFSWCTLLSLSLSLSIGTPSNYPSGMGQPFVAVDMSPIADAGIGTFLIPRAIADATPNSDVPDIFTQTGITTDHERRQLAEKIARLQRELEPPADSLSNTTSLGGGSPANGGRSTRGVPRLEVAASSQELPPLR